MAKSRDQMAEALLACLMVDHTVNCAGDSANLVDGLLSIARALNRLGNADASTPMGGLEALGKAILDSADRIANSIDGLADAISGHQGSHPIGGE